ncbi:MAG: rhomboid family intramembrane serine protease [Rhodobacteraceae bacterium]|nr:rhomboid family intramembrane serine protease [Paracoccaceae bacterium]
MSFDPDASPVNPLPPIVVALALIIVAIELVFQAGSAGLAGGPEATGWRISALETYGFREPLFNWMVENRQFRWQFTYGILTYPFVNYSFTGVVFSVVFILALGKMVGEIFSSLAFLLVFFGASIVGALAYGLVWDTSIVLFGAMPGAYGLIGAYSFLLWTNLAGTGNNPLRAFTLISLLMGLQLVWGLLFAGSLGWVADLAGFVTGFGLSFVVSPGGWHQLVRKIRQR